MLLRYCRTGVSAGETICVFGESHLADLRVHDLVDVLLRDAWVGIGTRINTHTSGEGEIDVIYQYVAK